MFEGATTDWNINQVALVFWSNFYDNVYEHPERPPQKIIDNDDLLDKWVEDKSKEIEDRSRKVNHNPHQKTDVLNYDEVITFDDSLDDYFDDEEDAFYEEIVEEDEYNDDE